MLLQRIFLRFYFPLPPPPPLSIIRLLRLPLPRSATRGRHDSLETLFETLGLPPPPPPWIIERNKKRVFFFFIEKSYTNTIQRGIIVFLSFPDGKLRKIIRVFKYRIRLKEGRENNFGRFSRSLRLSYVTRMQPPLLAHLRLAHWLSRNNHDPRADSVPYFQQLIRLPGRRRRRRRDLRFVAFIRGELQAGTGYRYSSLNVYRVVCASNSAADLRL